MKKAEREERCLELRYAYMMGYERGYAAAMPMMDFVQGLQTLMDDKVYKKIPKDREPSSLTQKECEDLLEAAPFRRGKKKKVAKKKVVKKKTAKKKTTKKKSVKKKTAKKKTVKKKTVKKKSAD